MSPETRQQIIALALGIVFIVGFIVFAQRLGQFLRNRQQAERPVAEEVTVTPEAEITPSPTGEERRGFGILNLIGRLFGGGKEEKIEEVTITPTPTQALAELPVTPAPEAGQAQQVFINGKPTVIPQTGPETSLLIGFITLLGTGIVLRSRKP